jgi:hypothetical protein
VDFYSFTAGAQNYLFSFCNNVRGASCTAAGLPTASMSIKPGINGCLQSFGLATNASAKLLAADPTAGLALTYSGGPTCSDLSSSYTLFSLTCDRSTAFAVTSLMVLQANCAIEVSARTAAACPAVKPSVVTPLGAGYIAAIVVVVSLSLYCVGGMGVKRYRFGSSGIETVPHIDTMRKVRAAAGRLLRRGGGDADEAYQYVSTGEEQLT